MDRRDGDIFSSVNLYALAEFNCRDTEQLGQHTSCLEILRIIYCRIFFYISNKICAEVRFLKITRHLLE